MPSKSISIFHTSDIHGHFLSQDYAQKTTSESGASRLSQFLKATRHPGDIYMDTGDVLQGNALAYYLAKHPSTPHPFSTVFNALKLDYFTLGNHDFNFGLPVLSSFLDPLNAQIINANILRDGTPFYGVPHVIHTCENGVKLGIIGLTTHYIPNWENPAHIAGLEFHDAFSSLTREIQVINDQCDFLIVNYHGGFEGDLETFDITSNTGENQGIKMLQELPEIDLLLTGHQHQTLHQKVGNTWVSQPGMNAASVHVITLDFGEGIKAPTVRMQAIDLADYSEDPDILDLLSDVESHTQSFLDQPIGQFDQAYRIADGFKARLNKHPLVTWINQVQLNATGADVALCGLGNAVTGFNQSVTLRDVLATYVYPNTLVVKAVTGDALLKALEKTSRFFALKDGELGVSNAFETPKKEYYNYDMYDPITYTIDVREPVGHRIKDARLNGIPINPDTIYKVAMNNYRASGGGDYPMFKDATLLLDTQQEIVTLLIEAISNGPVVTLDDPKNITILGD